MNTKSALTALSLSLLVALGAGCANDEVAEEGIVAETGVVADPVVEPVIGADPALGTGVTPTTGIAPAAGARGEFTTWDMNSDGMLDNNEFRTRFNDGGWYGDWDGDRSGTLSEQEWGTVNTAWGDAPEGVDTNGLFDIWDADEDGLISNDEAMTGAYSTWDRDRNNMIDQNEFNAGVNWFGR